MVRRNARALLAPLPGADGVLGAPTRHLSVVARGDDPCSDRQVVELISIPGRFRELLARFGPLDTLEDRLRDRRHPTAWTAIETMDHVANSLHVWAKWAIAILEGGGDDFPAVRVHAPRATSNQTPTLEVLASLHMSALELVRAVSRDEPSAWERPVLLGTRSLSVRDVLDHGVREVHRHLADVEALLSGAPPHGAPGH